MFVATICITEHERFARYSCVDASPFEVALQFWHSYCMRPVPDNRTVRQPLVSIYTNSIVSGIGKSHTVFFRPGALAYYQRAVAK